ncbi:lysophospholipase L1-like esterase [Isoptericola jiangsuensis]|uniref:Lysophospholipase L1-like esterase n=1 Tax=Isoptericola jiangsuensis TaxID=548579 RepID=A0A2A9F2U0_9MICO|nr:GDSL-type esterase/lipase family protein [Isoptericola jiangsuensis]PFG44739.1 lysophospholipase L1-like esterase [Isoptericola jiangsuensis]
MTSGTRDVRVCFVGDSFVAGVGDPTALGWVGRVVAASAARGLPLTAYNLGVRRQTSVEVAARLPAEVAPRLVEAADPRVVLSFGVNDTTAVDGVPRVDPGVTVEALHAAVRAVAPVPVLLVGPPAVVDPAQDARVRHLTAALRSTCGELGVPFVDAHAATVAATVWHREVEAGDGAHPGAGGYALLAAAVTGPLLDWLGAPALPPGGEARP